MNGYEIMKEKWRKVPNYLGYEASTFGEIRRRGKILTTEISKLGYCRKYLKDLKINLLIHRAVALAFIPNPENKLQVNHKDGNKQNNYVPNLEWVTPSENMKHSFSIGRKIIYGQDAGRSKLTNIQVGIIREALKHNHTQKKIAKYFRLDASTISRINTGDNWSRI